MHYPIALYTLELVLLLFWSVKPDPAYLRFARFAFLAGYCLMIAAMFAGWQDAGGWAPPVRRHASSAFVVAGWYSTRLALWQWGKPGAGYFKVLQILGAFTGCALVFFTAQLGGKLVYK
ncbi:MAG: hypothetical protein HY586_04025 [Candidatus Omnitrophica bacterium]|nr:hypothetical protein [Candidatus Omnitrophota bacterium]